jgi:hypothetical protein
MVAVPRLAMLPPNSDYPGVDTIDIDDTLGTHQAHDFHAFCHLPVRMTTVNLRASLHVSLSRE